MSYWCLLSNKRSPRHKLHSIHVTPWEYKLDWDGESNQHVYLRKHGNIAWQCSAHLLKCHWVVEAGQHWLRLWFIACTTRAKPLPERTMTYWQLYTRKKKKLRWKLNQNTKYFIQRHALENAYCNTTATLSRPHCVNTALRVWHVLLPHCVNSAWCVWHALRLDYYKANSNAMWVHTRWVSARLR